MNSEMERIRTRGADVVHHSRTDDWQRRWVVNYFIAGVEQIHECSGVDLEALLDWIADRADNATITVRPAT